MDAGKIWVQLGLDDKEFKNGIKQTEAYLGGMGKKISGVGQSMSLAITAPLTLAGGYVYKFTKDWEENMAKINTTAQLSQEELAKLSQTLKNLGGSVNADMSKVPEAYEKIISQTGDAALSTEILAAALKGAKAGFTDLDVVAGAISQSLSAIGAGGASAQEIIDTLFAAKRVGAGEFEDFANYIPQLIAAGKNLGVNYQEVAGAFAYMTGKGNDAASSAMLLQNAFNVLGKGEIQKGLQSVGVAVYDAEGKMRGLTDIFGDLQGVIGDMTNEEVSAFYESIGLVDMQAKQAFSVMTSEVSKLEEAMSATADATGELDTALEYAKNPANTLQEAMSMLQQIALGFGDILLPAMNAVILKLNILLKWVSNLSDESKTWIVSLLGIAAAIGPVLMGVGKFIQIIPSLNSGLMSVVKIVGKMTTALMANPYMAAAAAIIFLISVLYTYGKTQEDLKKDWEALKKAWTDSRAMESLLKFYTDIFGNLFDAVNNVITVFQDLLHAFGIATNATSGFETILRFLISTTKAAMFPLNFLIKGLSTLTGIARFVVDVFKDWKNLSIEDIFNKMGDGVRDFVQNNPLTDLGRSIKEVFTGATEDSGSFQDAMRFDFQEMKRTAKNATVTIEDLAQTFADSFEDMSEAQRESIKAVRLEYLKSVEEWIDGAVAKMKAEGFLNQSLNAQLQALERFAKDAKSKMDIAMAEITGAGGDTFSPFVPDVDPGEAETPEQIHKKALEDIQQEYKRAIALSSNYKQKLEAELKSIQDEAEAFRQLSLVDGYDETEIAIMQALKLSIDEITGKLVELEEQKEEMAANAAFEESLEAEVQSIREGLLTEEEMIKKSWWDRVHVIQQAMAAGVLTIAEGNALIQQITVETTKTLQENTEGIKTWGESWKEAGTQMQDALESMVEDMVTSAVDMLASGKGMASVGLMVMSAFADMAIQVGKIAVGTAIAVGGIKEALKSLNPYVAAGAGLALIALGGFVKSQLSSIGNTQGLATGGIVTSGGVFKVGEEGEELVSLPRGSAVTPNHMLNGAQGGYIASTRISGRDLEILIERAAAQTKRR